MEEEKKNENEIENSSEEKRKEKKEKFERFWSANLAIQDIK